MDACSSRGSKFESCPFFFSRKIIFSYNGRNANKLKEVD